MLLLCGRVLVLRATFLDPYVFHNLTLYPFIFFRG